MMIIGLAGIIVPVLPGLPLVWAGVAVWAFAQHDLSAWLTLAVATGLAAGGVALKYLLPGRRLRTSGTPWTTLALGAALGAVGFFLIPVVGLLLGLVLGVFLAEWARLGSRAAAWPATRACLSAVGWSIAIELAAGLLITVTWAIGLLLETP